MASLSSQSELYKTVPSAVVKANSKILSVEELPSQQTSAKQAIEGFLNLRLKGYKFQDDMLSKMQRQTMFLESPRKHSKQGSTHSAPRNRKLSNREKKALKLHQIPSEGQKYEDFLLLHSMWLSYMDDLLQIKSKKEVNLAQLNQKVMKADYHGSMMKVWRSKCPSYVGTEGILLQETQNTLRLIAKDNKIRTIPKANSIFTFDVHTHRFYLYGNHMKFKASERSAKKFKEKSTLDL